MPNQFKILVVDDQFYMDVANVLAANHLLQFEHDPKPGEPSSVNSQATKGLLVRVVRYKNTPADNNSIDDVGAIDRIGKEYFDIFLLDIDLSDTHQGDPDAQGYGFDIWREAVKKCGVKDKFYIIYTRSHEVLKVCGALCYDPNMPTVETSPLIIQFGSKTSGSIFETKKEEVDLLCNKIGQFLEKRAKDICTRISSNKGLLRSLLDDLIREDKWDMEKFERLKQLEMDGWTVTTLFPKYILSVDANIRLLNGDLDDQAIAENRESLFKIRNLAFCSYGELILQLLYRVHFQQYSSVALRRKMEEETGQGKVDHYILKAHITSNLWANIYEELRSEFLPMLRDARLEGHYDKFSDFFSKVKQFDEFAKFISQPSRVAQGARSNIAPKDVEYLGWIRELYGICKICITKQDIEIIESVLRANLEHNPIPIREIKREIISHVSDAYQNYQGLEYKVSNVPENWTDYTNHLDAVEVGLNKPFTNEHLSELREIICGYYNGLVEFITPFGSVKQAGGKAIKDDQIRTTLREGIIWRFWFPEQSLSQ